MLWIFPSLVKTLYGTSLLTMSRNLKNSESENLIIYSIENPNDILFTESNAPKSE